MPPPQETGGFAGAGTSRMVYFLVCVCVCVNDGEMVSEW